MKHSSAASSNGKKPSEQKNAGEWEKNARLDPLFAILSSSHGRDGKWDVEQFFATGRTEVGRVFSHLAEIGVVPDRTGRFLDFGCGVGRVSQALAQRFASGAGIDISARMIELAGQYNVAVLPIDFVQNTAPELSVIPSASIDFVYSHIVLQHISNDLQRRFIGEFARILKPGGFAFFQIPIENLSPARAEAPPSWLKRQLPKPLKDRLKRLLGMKTEDDVVSMEMNVLPDAEVARAIGNGGCELIRLSYSNSTEPDHNGMVDYFDRPEALKRIEDGSVRSTFLSGCYLLQKTVH
jgi:SAM-dependent methyltransferase